MGLWVGIAGNQTARAGHILRSMDLPADLIATSDDWGVAKPGQAFFQRVIEVAPGCPEDIVYVGDHRNNDVLPVKAAGLRFAHLRRGPWGHLWADHPRVIAAADWRLTSLMDLPSLLASEQAG
jgi:FMN phosphatase YigB (HAD superfamily)